MGLRHIRQEPSEVDAPFVWVNIKLKQEAEERQRNAEHKPYVHPVPESWVGRVYMAVFLVILLF